MNSLMITDSLQTVDTNQYVKPLRANPTKWSNTLKQVVGKPRQIV